MVSPSTTFTTSAWDQLGGSGLVVLGVCSGDVTVVEEPRAPVVVEATSSDVDGRNTVVVPLSTASGTHAATRTTITAGIKMLRNLT
jgi:hypothetical protein